MGRNILTQEVTEEIFSKMKNFYAIEFEIHVYVFVKSYPTYDRYFVVWV